MIHLSVAVGEFFRLLLTAMVGGAVRLVVAFALAVAAVAALALALRSAVRRLRRR